MFTAKRHGPDRETGPRNPKIQALVNEIVNDSVSHMEPAAEVQKMPSMEPAIRTIAPPAVDLLPPTPRTKGDIICYSDNDGPNIKVKYLPATVGGLLKRFNKIYEMFTQGRHEHRNELVALLDELLRQNGISREEYTRRNNVIAKSLDAAVDDSI